MMKWFYGVGIAAAIVLSGMIWFNTTYFIGHPVVVDADTIRVEDKSIRLWGIDALEKSQSCWMPDKTVWGCGNDAKLALIEFIGSRTVVCEKTGRDVYFRIIGKCRVIDGIISWTDLNRWVVQQGWGFAARDYPTSYLDDEKEAEHNKRGLWAAEKVLKPWDFRHLRKKKSVEK